MSPDCRCRSTITVVGIDGGSFEPQADPTKYIGDENCDFSKPLQLKRNRCRRNDGGLLHSERNGCGRGQSRPCHHLRKGHL